LEEVRMNLPQWKEALKKEYDSLRSYGAIRPIGAAEYAGLQDQFEVVESLPTMLVAVKKPPMRLKARVVACGNHAQVASGCTTAGGVDTVVVRTLVSLAAHQDLTILTSDIKTAFLQAPRRSTTPGRITLSVGTRSRRLKLDTLSVGTRSRRLKLDMHFIKGSMLKRS